MKLNKLPLRSIRFNVIHEIKKVSYRLIRFRPHWKLFLWAFLFFPVYLCFSSARCLLKMEQYLPVDLDALRLADTFIFGDYVAYLFENLACIALDIIAAIPYILHGVLPFLFVGLQIHRNDLKRFVHFLWLFSTCNFIYLSFQIFYPTAPPWLNKYYSEIPKVFLKDWTCSRDTLPMIETTGMCCNYSTVIRHGLLAGRFKNIDEFFEINIFTSIYSNNKYLFGAFPSMHVGWPVIIHLAGSWTPSSKFVSLAHCIFISWAAVYSEHHYVVDVLAGALIAVLIGKIMKIITIVQMSNDDTENPV